MAEPLSPTDIPLPGQARDPGVRPATTRTKLAPVVDPTGKGLASAASDLESGLKATVAANRRFSDDLNSIAATAKDLADKRQAVEDKAFVDRFELEYSKKAGAIQAEALSSPDATDPEFVNKLDQRLADAQAETLKALRESGSYAPSQAAISSTESSGLNLRTTLARSSAIAAHNNRLGVVVESTTQNVLQIGRDAAATGDLVGGIDRANKSINGLQSILAPDKFLAVKRQTREQVTEMVVRGYIERGEFAKAKAVIDGNRSFTGTEAVIADVARKNGVDPTFIVATARVESSVNPVARPGIDPRTGQPYSRASGLFQFTPDTAKAYGLPADAASASVEEQTRAAVAKTKDDTRILKGALGRAPSSGELYMAWFLGPDTAAKVITAPPGASVEAIVGPKAVRANPTVLGGKTAGDVMDWAATKMVIGGAGMAIPGRKFEDNMGTADKVLKFSDEERSLYQRHLTNLYGAGGVTNQDGSRSTLFATTAEIDGKTYILPTVWNGKILSADDAVERARAEGLDKFPAYGSTEEAERRYSAMHRYMDKDATAWSEDRRSQANADIGRFMKEDARVTLLNLAETQQRQLEDREEKRRDKALKQAGEANMREIYRRSEGLSIDPTTNTPIPLTAGHVDSVRHLLSPTEYKAALALLAGGGAEDDVNAVIDLVGKVATASPAQFLKDATGYLEKNQLKTSTFTTLVQRNETARKDDAPASPYKSGRTYIEQALNPGFLTGPAEVPARIAMANGLREFDNWVEANPNMTRSDALLMATNIVSRYAIINTDQMKIANGLSKYFGVKSTSAITIPDVAAAKQSLADDIRNNRVTRAEAETEALRLQNWQAILDREKRLREEKPGPGASPAPRTPLVPPLVPGKN